MADEKKTSDVALPSDPAQVRELLKRAQGGDASALPAVRQFLRNPDGIRLLGGD